MRANAPRHVGLLLQLLREAERDGSVAKLPPVQRLSFVMGSVVAPLVIVSGLLTMGVTPGLPARTLAGQALSDAAIRERIDLALAALRPVGAAPSPRRRSRV